MTRPPRIDAILSQVASEHQITVDEMLSRGHAHAGARAEAMRRIRALTFPNGLPPSYPQIGRWLKRDHSTVINACSR